MTSWFSLMVRSCSSYYWWRQTLYWHRIFYYCVCVCVISSLIHVIISTLSVFDLLQTQNQTRSDPIWVLPAVQTTRALCFPPLYMCTCYWSVICIRIHYPDDKGSHLYVCVAALSLTSVTSALCAPQEISTSLQSSVSCWVRNYKSLWSAAVLHVTGDCTEE